MLIDAIAVDILDVSLHDVLPDSFLWRDVEEVTRLPKRANVCATRDDRPTTITATFSGSCVRVETVSSVRYPDSRGLPVLAGPWIGTSSNDGARNRLERGDFGLVGRGQGVLSDEDIDARS